MSDKTATAIWLEKYFEKLRNSGEFHLGLGDVRLTLGQQEAIVDIVNTMCELDSDRFIGGGD